jgi:hypothetical protein
MWSQISRLLCCAPLAACGGAEPSGEAPPGDPSLGGHPPREPWQPGAPTTGSPSTSPDPPSTTSTSDMDASTGPLDPGTSSGSDTTANPSDCGDGLVQPPEQCDAGYAHNKNDAACTQDCQLARCGDGLVHAGVEQCDLADANNDSTYDGCREDCTLGDRCGDGVLQPDDEECDGLPVEGHAPCILASCKFTGRLAFVTSAKFQGDFGGLAHADALCVDAASAAGLDNAQQFKAWLSDGDKSAADRLPNAAADPGRPIVRRGGMLLAADLADLIADGPDVPLDVDEFGATLPPEEFVWTNLDLAGQPFSAVNHCQEWTSAGLSATARAGKASPESEADLPAYMSEFRWTSDTTQSCKWQAHLYCLED